MNKENLLIFLDNEIIKHEQIIVGTEALCRYMQSETILNPKDDVRKQHLESLKKKDFVVKYLKHLRQLREEVSDGRYEV